MEPTGRAAALAALLVLVALAPAPTALAQEAREGERAPFDLAWEPIPMLAGEVAQIVFSPTDPDVVYMGIQVNDHSMYRSDDGGKTWRRIHMGDHTKDVAVHPTDPDVAFYADSQSVWRTEDGGRSGRSGFERSYGPNFETAANSIVTLAIAPSDPNIVYAAHRGRPHGGSMGPPAVLLRSTDGGESFQEVQGDTPRTLFVVHVHPEDPQALLAGSHDGIHRSSDGGQTWRKAHAAPEVRSFATPDGETVLAATDAGLLRSEDGGATWAAASSGLPSTHVLRVRIAPSDPDVAWATTYEGVARSDDGGVTWRDVTGAAMGRNLKALAVHPEDPDVAIAATDTYLFDERAESLWRQGQYYGQGIFRTEDGGASWRRADAGTGEDDLEDLQAHPTRPHEVWAGQDGSRGAFRSRDGGQTWSLSPTLLTHYPMRFAWFPGDPDHLAVTSSHTGQAFGVTRDGGVNWETRSEHDFLDAFDQGSQHVAQGRHGSVHLHGLGVDPYDGTRVLVGSFDDPSPFVNNPLDGSHILRSTDGGATWQESDAGYPHEVPSSVHDILWDPDTAGLVYAATHDHDPPPFPGAERLRGNGVWRSTDGGATWERWNTGMSDDANVHAIARHPDDGNALLAATRDDLYRTANAGATWSPVVEGEFLDVAFDPAHPGVAYAGGEAGVLRSVDGGETWEDVTGNLPDGDVHAIAVDATGRIVYANVQEVGLFRAVDPGLDPIPHDEGATRLGAGQGGFNPDEDGGGGGGGPGDGRDRGRFHREGGDNRSVPAPGLLPAILLVLAGAVLRRRQPRR